MTLCKILFHLGIITMVSGILYAAGNHVSGLVIMLGGIITSVICMVILIHAIIK